MQPHPRQRGQPRVRVHFHVSNYVATPVHAVRHCDVDLALVASLGDGLGGMIDGGGPLIRLGRRPPAWLQLGRAVRKVGLGEGPALLGPLELAGL